MISGKTCKTFNDLRWKLDRHPAFPDIISKVLVDYSLQEVCKRGMIKAGPITLYKTPANYRRYKDRFDEELKAYKPDDPIRKYAHILVTYEEHYGEPWTVDHVEYWGEVCFAVYRYKDTKGWADPRNWDGCVGPSCSARSFEEMMIKLSRLFFKKFGRWDSQDFLTKKEKANHKALPLFLKKGRGWFSNSKRIFVNPAEINHRWLKWFLKKPEARKQWGSFNDMVKDSSK